MSPTPAVRAVAFRLLIDLPATLLDRILTTTGLHPNDLFALRFAALQDHPALVRAVDSAADFLLAQHRFGPHIRENPLPGESSLCALQYLARLDAAPHISATANTSVWSSGRNEHGQGARPSPVDINTPHPCTPVVMDAHQEQFASLVETPPATEVTNRSPTPFGAPAHVSPRLLPPRSPPPLSPPSSPPSSPPPPPGCPPPAIVRVEAGAAHSACINVCGALHVAGANDRGQLGLPSSTPHFAWTRVRPGGRARIAQVSCGDAHTIALTGRGVAFVTGGNHAGQLGIGDRRDRARFTPVRALCDAGCEGGWRCKRSVGNGILGGVGKGGGSGMAGDGERDKGMGVCECSVAMVAAGRAHSVLLLDNGRVLAAGDNGHGQLGGHRGADSPTFETVKCFGRRVVRVACGVDTTMLLTEDNMVLVTGKRQGGLSVIGGLGGSKVTHMTVGLRFAVVRTDEWDVAMSTHRKRFELTEELMEVAGGCVSAGVGHYVIVERSGAVLAAGTNAFGQVAAGHMGLTIEGSTNARVIRAHHVPLSRVGVPEGYRGVSAAAGAYHTLYLLVKNDAEQGGGGGDG